MACSLLSEGEGEEGEESRIQIAEIKSGTKIARSMMMGNFEETIVGIWYDSTVTTMVMSTYIRSSMKIGDLRAGILKDSIADIANRLWRWLLTSKWKTGYVKVYRGLEEEEKMRDFKKEAEVMDLSE